MPVTTPAALTVAIVVGVLLHVPPGVVLVSVVVKPWQTVSLPVIMPASTRGWTVMITESLSVPQRLVTV